MTINPYIILGFALSFNALANILAKVGVNKIEKTPNLLVLIPKIITNPIIISAIVCFVINFGLYVIALSKINLSIAYPIMVSLGFVIIVSVSWLFLKETITLVQVIGILLILIGVLLIKK